MLGMLTALASPSPAPAATPAPVTSPAVTVSGILTGYTHFKQHHRRMRAIRPALIELSNALVTIARTTGIFRFSLTAGAYAYPVVGVPLTPTFQAGTNVSLYGYLPNAYVQYVPNASWTISAGKLPTLLGQENGFTFQNPNFQRGLVWNLEPVVSRGVRVAYTGTRWNGTLEYNDGFYSGNHRAIEGLLGWTPSAASSLQFVFIVPDANTPPNVTAAVANKREYDLMYTQQLGKLQLLPYALWVVSPASSSLAYARTETAFGAVVIASYAFNSVFSLGGRFEVVSDNSSLQDFGFNSDFVGYGPGSSATTFTLTPAYKAAHWLVRGEWSYVTGYNILPGLGFGSTGTGTTESRLALEAGVQF